MKSWFFRNRPTLLFLGIFLCLCIYYGYPEAFNYTPRSTHQWRQADGASIALNYYQNGMDFFEPQLHHVLGGEGHTVGEFPIIYYCSAILYKIFGPNEGWFRLLDFLILFIGLYCLFRMVLESTKDTFLAIAIPLLVMSSPVMAYYAFNFVPNTPALGLVLIAWWFFYRYYQEQRLKHFYASMLFFLFAGLLKIPMLMSFLVLGAAYVAELIPSIKMRNQEKLFVQRWKLFPGFLMVVVGVVGWKFYADHYNEINDTSYFLANIKPIWGIDAERRKVIYDKVMLAWFHAYYHRSVFYLIIALTAFVLFSIRRHKSLLTFGLTLLGLGVIAYIALWYQQFQEHDYYVIDLMVYPILLFVTVAIFLKKSMPWLINTLLVRLLIVAFIIFNLQHAKSQLVLRYDPDSVFMRYFTPEFFKTTELQTFLKNLGIAYPEKVVSIPDTSPNNTLYHLNLTGWSGLYLSEPVTAKRIKHFASLGANYLIINKKEYLEIEDLQAVLEKPLGDFENAIFVFDIQYLKE